MKHFNKIFPILAIILIVWSFTIGGFNLGQHDYQNAVPNFIVGAFWLVVLVITHFERITDERLKGLEREIKLLEKFSKMTGELAEKAEKVADDMGEHICELTDYEAMQLSTYAEEAAHEVMQCKPGDRKSTEEEINRIENLFHEKTGAYLSHVSTGSKGMVAEISKTPFDESTPATEKHGMSERQAEAADRGDKARAAVNAKEVKVKDGNKSKKDK